jgi:uncharacterized protein
VLVWLAKKSIEHYWNTVPEDKRKICIYRITCSKFVYNKFNNNGFVSGILAYFYRMKSCNHKYIISHKNNMVIIKDSQGNIIEENEINPLIVKEFKNS